MKKLTLSFLLSVSLLPCFANAASSGDDLVKSWKNKQKAYYLGETLVETNTVKAIERMDKILKKYKWSSNEKVSMLHKLGDLHLNLGRIIENKQKSSRMNIHISTALKIYKNIINKYPKYSKIEHVFFARGFELFMKKNYSRAEKTLGVLNKRFPRSKYRDDIFVIRADSFYELKQYKSAVSLYEKAVNSSDNELSFYSRYRRSWSLFNLRKYNQAYDYLYALAKQDKENKKQDLYSSGEAKADLPRFFLKQSKKTQAFQDFNAIAGYKKTEDLLYELSELYFEAGEWNKASGVYSDLIAKYSNSKKRSVYHLKKGIALSTKRRISKSSLELTKGLESCRSKLCKSIAQDEIFKLVNDWEKHWRQNQSDKNYSSALATVYPSLAKNAEKKSEKSKIYLLLAEVEYHLKHFMKSSLAFEQAYNENPKASYAKQARWNAIETLMQLKNRKWKSKEVQRLSRLVNSYISDFPNEKKSINAQSFLAKTYNDSNQFKMASQLYRRVSEEHMFTTVGADAYNNYLKIQVKGKKYKTVAEYLIELKKLDKKGVKSKLINSDLDQTYNEWSEFLAKEKKISSLVAVYNQALQNRSESSFKKSWLWNKALGLATLKSNKKAAFTFLSYVDEFGNKEGKRVEALNNALVSFKKAKMRKDALSVISKLLQLDSKNKQDWLVESVYIHIEMKNYMQAYDVLSQVEKRHPQKNIVFEKLIKKFSEKDLFKVRKSNLSSYSGDSVGELLLRLVGKINNLDSQQTKSVALQLKNLRVEDKNYNAKGHYILAIHEYRKFKKIDFGINSRLQRSLDKIIKKVMKIDDHFRNAVSVASGRTQTKALIGLGDLYLNVAERYTVYAKKRFKAEKSITEVEETMRPFLEQSDFFAQEAKKSLSGVSSKRTVQKLKSKINRLFAKARSIDRWYKKTSQIKLAKRVQ